MGLEDYAFRELSILKLTFLRIEQFLGNEVTTFLDCHLEIKYFLEVNTRRRSHPFLLTKNKAMSIISSFLFQSQKKYGISNFSRFLKYSASVFENNEARVQDLARDFFDTSMF